MKKSQESKGRERVDRKGEGGPGGCLMISTTTQRERAVDESAGWYSSSVTMYIHGSNGMDGDGARGWKRELERFGVGTLSHNH